VHITSVALPVDEFLKFCRHPFYPTNTYFESALEAVKQVNLFLSVILEPKYESCGITMRVPK
jgi:hypothetical protein